MKITNSLLFVAFVLGARSLLLSRDHQPVASPTFFNVNGTAVLSRIHTAGVMTPDEVAALLSESAGYSDPSANTGDQLPESTTGGWR
jgi:hypothetical protein